MERYDIAVIGGGPAGYLAAERACEAGLATLLVEKNKVGGVCLNEGCIPTKTYLYSGKLYESLLHGKEKGVHCESAALHHDGVRAKKAEVVKTLVNGVSAALKRKGADVVQGTASVSGSQGNFLVATGGMEYRARNLLIATGSIPIMPPIPGLEEGLENGSILTSRELLETEQVPDSLVIVGAGVIGLEMAEYFNTAGSKVSVVEMLDHIGGEIDNDAADVLQKMLEAKGIAFHLQSKVVSLEGGTASFEKDGAKHALPYDKVLMSVGRKPGTEGIDGLDLLKQNGAIVTDDRCATNLGGVYAAGDVNGRYMLAHVAYREAEVAINNISGKPDRMDYRAIPCVIYTNPEAAYAGITQQQAAEAGYDVQIRKASINMSGRHVAEQGISDGFCKLVVDRRQGILLGAVLVCTYASEIIYALTLMIQNKIPPESIKRTIFPHPTVCEIIREAIFCD